MDKYLKRKQTPQVLPTQEDDDHPQMESTSKMSRMEPDLSDLPTNPRLRTRISNYSFNARDKVRRVYLLKGPCQPRNHIFPQKKIGSVLRRFNPCWYDDYGSWLEYSIAKDAAFCLCCYLFRPNIGEQGGADAFVVEGFSNWKKSEKIQAHVGWPRSTHNLAYMKSEDLLKQDQQIQTCFTRHSDRTRNDYRIRLNTSIDCVCFLLHHGLAFRGHDESEESNNQGNFLELLQFTANHNESIKNVVLQNALENHKLTTPEIQKDITNAATEETINVILKDLRQELFSILVDESLDISIKEDMVVVIRFVDKKGCVIERFIGIRHVEETTTASLKVALMKLLTDRQLSITRLRGQGFDGASNMQGEFNGLKTLILKENKYAFYVHCFAHQLQLVLIHVAKHHAQIALLFNLVTNAVNVVGVSCKRRDILRNKQAAKIIEKLKSGELLSGQGLNQETNIKCSGDMRWGSHYGTLISLILMFSSVIDVLEIVVGDGSSSEQKGEAYALLDLLQFFGFVLNLHLMRNLLAITNSLSNALQRKDQDIVNAMNLVKISKQRLQTMREDGWDSLLNEVYSFCVKHNK